MVYQSNIWGFPLMGVPQIIRFERISHINHPFWGTFLYGNPHLESYNRFLQTSASPASMWTSVRPVSLNLPWNASRLRQIWLRWKETTGFQPRDTATSLSDGWILVIKWWVMNLQWFFKDFPSLNWNLQLPYMPTSMFNRSETQTPDFPEIFLENALQCRRMSSTLCQRSLRYIC